MFLSHFTPGPELRIQLNMGCLFDIPSGRYLTGADGESILNGGLAYFTGVAGKGNTYKSTLMHFLCLRGMARYGQKVGAMIYDTEMSLTVERMYQLALTHPQLAGVDLEREGRMLVTDSTVMIGEIWYRALNDFAKTKPKDKEMMGTTPFLSKKDKKPIKALYPTMVEIDSLSQFTTSSVGNIYEEANVGDSKANTDSLRGAAAKSQMLVQMPTLTAANNLFMMVSAHVGKVHQLDPRAPPAKQLAHLKNQQAFKHVPEKFHFLPNNLYISLKAEPLLGGDKTPMYPAGAGIAESDMDLNLMVVQNLRAKAGPTGNPFELIVSQREGVLVTLSEFNYIKGYNRYGLNGNDRSYALDLLPDVLLSRTTIRTKIRETPALVRAMEITSELCQMERLGYQTQATAESLPGEEEIREHGMVCKPKELYDDLIAKGYDWEVLLNTRGYWTFEENKKGELPFLSTLDLLKMRAGLYHPKWYPKDKFNPKK